MIQYIIFRNKTCNKLFNRVHSLDQLFQTVVRLVDVIIFF